VQASFKQPSGSFDSAEMDHRVEAAEIARLDIPDVLPDRRDGDALVAESATFVEDESTPSRHGRPVSTPTITEPIYPSCPVTNTRMFPLRWMAAAR
jgi:hypothetical protein